MATRRLSFREKIILVFCICLLLLYVSTVFIFKPLHEKLLSLRKKISNAERKLENNLAIIPQGKIIDKQYDKYAALLKQQASDEQEMASILSEIESVASQVEMRVSDVKPKRVKNVDFFNHFSVSLSIEGELNSIIRFIYILQNEPYLFRVDEVRFEKRSLRTSKIKCQFVLSRALIP